MKKIILYTLIVMSVSCQPAYAWYCEASSNYGFGWGNSYSLGAAKRIALQNCAINTPYGGTCFIDYCN